MKRGCCTASLAVVISLMAFAGDRPIASLVQDLNSAQVETRVQALRELDDLGPKAAEAAPAVIIQLDHSSSQVRTYAAHVLASIGPAAQPGVAALIRAVVDPDPVVRREAVRALVAVGAEVHLAVPVLGRAMDDTDPAVRARALEGLSRLGEAAVPDLIEAVKNPTGIRCWACEALADIGPKAKAAVPALIDRSRDSNADARREALLALGEIGPDAVAAVPRLREAVGDRDSTVALAAIYALGRMGDAAHDAEPLLIAKARSDQPLAKVIACWALARVRGATSEATTQAIPVLAEAMRSRESAVRTAASRAILDLRPAPGPMIAALEKTMEGADPALMAVALDVLAQYGRVALPGLEAALKQPALQARTALVLRRMGPAAAPAVPALSEALAEARPTARREILFALAAIGPAARPAVPSLVRLLAKPDAETQYAAVYAVGRIGPAAIEAKPLLEKGLSSGDELIRTACVWALARIDPQCPTVAQGLPVLIENLRNTSPVLRIEAAASLRCLGPQARSALPDLKQALHDDNELVREMAGEAIRTIESTATAPSKTERR
jgi:HEAT repeat protein